MHFSQKLANLDLFDHIVLCCLFFSASFGFCMLLWKEIPADPWAHYGWGTSDSHYVQSRRRQLRVQGEWRNSAALQLRTFMKSLNRECHPRLNVWLPALLQAEPAMFLTTTTTTTNHITVTDGQKIPQVPAALYSPQSDTQYI